jgi:predicted ATPase
LQRRHEVLTLARQLSHPYSLLLALYFTAFLHHLRLEAQTAWESAEELITLAIEHESPSFRASGGIIQGWACAVQGQRDTGIAQMHEGLAALQAMGAQLMQPYAFALLAGQHGKRGHTEEGLRLVAKGLVLEDTYGERHWQAELYRHKSELLLQQAAPDQQEGEHCFYQALEVSRRQQAKSWELRAATSLARLWQFRDKRQEAYDLLAPVYGWFTEGFDTTDLKEAKALLEELP